MCVSNQCLLALLLCEKCSIGAIRCDAMQTVCRGLTIAVRSVVRVVEFWIETALLVCLNSASAALVIAASASDTRSVEEVDLGMC